MTDHIESPAAEAERAEPDPTEGLAHHYLSTDAGRVHVVEAGPAAAPLVVLLAGFPETWRAWHSVMPLLARRHRVVAVDLPGQGGSDAIDGEATTVRLATAVHEVIAQLHPDGAYTLVAHDVGAWVGFAYGLLFQDEMAGLALLDAGIPGVTLPDAVPLDPELTWKTWHFAFHQLDELPELLLDGREREYLTWFIRHKTLRPDTLDQTLIDHYARSIVDNGGMGPALAVYRAIPTSTREHQRLLETRRLHLPVLAVSAEGGSIPDMAASIRAFADDVHAVRIPDSGHFIPEEQPLAVTAAVEVFLQSVESAA